MYMYIYICVCVIVYGHVYAYVYIHIIEHLKSFDYFQGLILNCRWANPREIVTWMLFGRETAWVSNSWDDA